MSSYRWNGGTGTKVEIEDLPLAPSLFLKGLVVVGTVGLELCAGGWGH